MPTKHNYVLKIKEQAGGADTINLNGDFEKEMGPGYKPPVGLTFAVSEEYPGESQDDPCRDVFYNNAWHRY